MAEAITENFTVDVTRTNTDPATRDANPTVTEKEFPKSASRLILFMSGFTAITVAVCLTTFYIYVYFRTGYAPNLDNLTNVLLSFGIGVIPYAFNKVSTALTLKP
ncbi:MAG: hypothetical protein IPP29_03265 [Bacteroidetes bacterium]|nr:hypothetical protein [Bacteroidota bacterium]